jgi:hypothetical protein
MLPFLSPEGPDAGLTESQAREINRRADLTFEAIAGVPSTPTVTFKPQNVFDLIFAGAQLANFMLSSDLRTCAYCSADGELQLNAEAHHPTCKVRRWFEAVDSLKLGLEVRS